MGNEGKDVLIFPTPTPRVELGYLVRSPESRVSCRSGRKDGGCFLKKIAQEQLVVPLRQRGSSASVGLCGLRKGIGRLARWLTIAEWTVGRARPG